MSEHIALICSVPLESDPVTRRLGGRREAEVGRRSALEGEIRGTPVLLITGGMGKTNAAQSLTAACERGGIRAVVAFGVAGAYPGSEAQVGDVALASAEIYGDEGVQTPAGWISTEAIGIPLASICESPVFNRFDLVPGLVESAREALTRERVSAHIGPFVTVSCCSGTLARGREMAERFGAICETMEGAAYAHVAAHYALPFLELRGISNRVEDRDLSGWRLQQAAEAAARGVEIIVGGFATGALGS